MNSYKALKQKHQEEVNNFPIMFAFSDKQFTEGMDKLGLTASDTDKIFSVGGGGYIRKTDSEAMTAMFSKHEQERKEAIDGDKTGTGYIYDMFLYELNNHEFGYTREYDDTLNALGLTYEQVTADTKLSSAFNKAVKSAIKASADW